MQNLGQCFDLSGGSWVAVEEETIGDVFLVQPVGHHPVGDIVWHEVAGVDVGFGFLAQLGEFFDVVPKDVTGGNRGDGHFIGNAHSLSAFA